MGKMFQILKAATVQSERHTYQGTARLLSRTLGGMTSFDGLMLPPGLGISCVLLCRLPSFPFEPSLGKVVGLVCVTAVCFPVG